MTPATPEQPKLSLLQMLGLATALAAAFTVFNWLQAGSPFSSDPIAATDDMVRMVTVREWLGGQSWYDPVLHRLGPPQGTVMHWSRLIDLPIGLLTILGNALGMNGELLAKMVWPFLNFVAAFAAFLVAVRRATGFTGLVPVIVIGGFALIGTNVFNTGFLDHHNAQLALTLWLVALLTPGGASPVRDLALAGVITSLMLAVGMEGLPFAVGGAIAVCIRLNLERGSFLEAARAYGLALALSHGLLFILLVAPSRYGMAYCDAFSDFHLVSAGLGGLVLWAGLSMPVRRHAPLPEIMVPLAAGAVVAIAAILLFPQCLADPMAALDPKLREFWIDKVIEAQNALQIAHLDPWLLVSLFSLPLMALAAGGWKIFREFPRAAIMPAMVFVLIATAVTAFQMRGTQFATPLSALALAMLVTGFAETAGKDKPLQLAAALALSCVLVWKVITLSAIAVFSGGQSGPLINAAGAAGSASCEEPAALAPLAAEVPGTVAAANSIGPAILYHTPHRVLSGPYHRNVEGNLAWINAMLGSADEARTIFAREGVTLLVLCPGDPDEIDFQAASPQGFAASLLAGTVPNWLDPVPVSEKSPLSLFRIKR